MFLFSSAQCHLIRLVGAHSNPVWKNEPKQGVGAFLQEALFCDTVHVFTNRLCKVLFCVVGVRFHQLRLCWASGF